MERTIDMAIDKELLDRLLNVRDPQDLFTKDGLIDELKKALSERMLAAELDDHLGPEAEARGHFPNDDAATKLLCLILNRSEKEWKMPPREWSMARAQFAVIFGERFIKAMAA